MCEVGNQPLSSAAFSFYYCDCNSTMIIICGFVLAGWGLWGIGKHSSSQQAFSVLLLGAGFPVVAGRRAGQDMTKMTGLDSSSAPRSTHQTLCLWFDCSRNVIQLRWDLCLCREISSRMEPQRQDVLLPLCFFSSTCGLTLLESESTEVKTRRQSCSLILWSPFSPQHPHNVHTCTLWSCADSAVRACLN